MVVDGDGMAPEDDAIPGFVSWYITYKSSLCTKCSSVAKPRPLVAAVLLAMCTYSSYSLLHVLILQILPNRGMFVLAVVDWYKCYS